MHVLHIGNITAFIGAHTHTHTHTHTLSLSLTNTHMLTHYIHDGASSA